MKPGIQSLQRKAHAARVKGKWPQAIKHLEVLCKVHPNSIDFSLDLADCYIQLEDFQGAVRVYARAFELAPSDPSLAASFGGALLRAGKPLEAKTLLLHCLDLDPNYIAARINLGGVYQALGDLKGCLNNALEAVSIDPTNAVAFNNLGSALSDLALWAEAQHAFETALMLQPTQLDALINVASCEAKLGNHAKAIKNYEEVLLKLPPEAKQRAEAIRFFASFQYLQLGELEKGWEYYEGGFSPLVPIAGARTPRLSFSQPTWSGEDLNGKTILLWREQGLGDEILFASCIPDLISTFPSVKLIIQCEHRLVEIFRRSFPLAKVIGESPEKIQDLDYHLPFGSLMRWFRGDIRSFQNKAPYLSPDPELKQEMYKRLDKFQNPNIRFVGICWRSGLISPTRNLNYTGLGDWSEILQKSDDYVFVNLQYGNCEEELREIEQKNNITILRWSDLDLKNDMERVFALVSCLDAVITVGTSVSAIAGALGVPTIYLAKRGWLFLGQERFPWFNSFHELIAEGDDPVASKLREVPALMRQILV